MENDKKAVVHPRLGRPSEVQRRYGLWILGGGEFRTVPDSFYRTPPRRFEFYSLSHLFRGAGRLWLAPDREWELEPGDAVLITPGLVNRYGGVRGERYCEDAVRFWGPVADQLLACGVLVPGRIPFGAVRRLRLIAELAQDPAAAAQINANLALQRLLVELYNERRRPAARSALEELLETVKADLRRWWTVAELAELCGMSPDRFRRHFQRATGKLPKTYVEELKLRRAAELLATGELSLGEIGRTLGYRDVYHFARRFKAWSGTPPGRYRQLSLPGGGEGR